MAKQELGELFWKITGDTRDIDKSLDQTDKKVGGLGGSFKGFGKIAIAAITAVAVVGIAKLSKELVLAASAAEETQNKFNVTFRAVGDEAAQAANTLADSFGLSQTAAQGLLADTGDLLTGFGFTGEEALGLSTQVQELAVDLASFTNFSGGAEGASAALTKGLLGERESMKALGIAISEADIQQLAEDKGIVGELDRQTKAQLTLELALRQSGNAIGDFARSESSFANQLRIAQANVENLQVELGSNLLPIANVGITIFNDLAKEALSLAENISAFVTSAEGSDQIATFIANIAGSVSALGAVAQPVFESMIGSLTNIIEPFRGLRAETESTGLGFTILGGIAATLSGAINIIGTVIAGTITNLINFGKTITEVGQLAASFAGVLTFQTSLSEFKEQILETGEAFKDFGVGLVTTSVDTFSSIGEFVTGFRDNAVGAADAATEAFQESFEKTKEVIVTALTEAGEATSAYQDDAIEGQEELNEELSETELLLIALQEKYGTVEEAEKKWSEGSKERMLELTNVGVGSLLSSFGDLGEAFAEGELGWDSFAKAGLGAIAAVLDALGSQLAAQAAVLIGAAFFSAGTSLAGLGPVLAGSAAAFASAGVVRGLAGSFEQGGIVPEIPGAPATGDKQLVAVNGGETITPADESGGGDLTVPISIDGRVIARVIVRDYINKGREQVSLSQGTRA